MKEKKCFKCGYVKPLADFYRHVKMADGFLNKCKECTKNDVRKNRVANIDYYREYDKERSMHPNRVFARNNYAQTDAGKKAAQKAKKNWREKNVLKRAAHIIVGNAIRDGKIKKGTECELCGGKTRLHGHHDNYDAPLAVRWVCPKCHAYLHKNQP